jgi:hypothetical protein
MALNLPHLSFVGDVKNAVQYFVTTLDSLGVVPELISC